MYFLHGLTVSLVISKPANSTTSLNLSGLRVIPCVQPVSCLEEAFCYRVGGHHPHVWNG